MAMHARPMPIDPYSPLPSSLSSINAAENEVISHPSPFVPIRLPIFALVIWLNDWIVRILSVGGGSGNSRRGITSTGRHRTFSESAESVEEGDAGDLEFTKRRSMTSRPADRINIGRRKVD